LPWITFEGLYALTVPVRGRGPQTACTFATSHTFISYKGVEKLVLALTFID